jgi:hypothetical protein
MAGDLNIPNVEFLKTLWANRLRKDDLNHDGFISQTEFLGQESAPTSDKTTFNTVFLSKIFTKIDLNKDEKISEDEFDAYLKAKQDEASATNALILRQTWLNSFLSNEGIGPEPLNPLGVSDELSILAANALPAQTVLTSHSELDLFDQVLREQLTLTDNSALSKAYLSRLIAFDMIRDEINSTSEDNSFDLYNAV